MLTYGAFSFIAPAALLGFLTLPILWWLLRVIPPAPRRVRFPAIRIIMQLVNPEESSAKTPIWLAMAMSSPRTRSQQAPAETRELVAAARRRQASPLRLHTAIQPREGTLLN